MLEVAGYYIHAQLHLAASLSKHIHMPIQDVPVNIHSSI